MLSLFFILELLSFIYAFKILYIGRVLQPYLFLYPHCSNIVNFVGLIQGLSVINANLKEKLENDISIRHNSVK